MESSAFALCVINKRKDTDRRKVFVPNGFLHTKLTAISAKDTCDVLAKPISKFYDYFGTESSAIDVYLKCK